MGSITKHQPNPGRSLFISSFIGTKGASSTPHQWQMWNQFKLWIQDQVVQVLRGWNVWLRWDRSGEGQQQRTTMQIPGHFVWQATTVLCIYAKPGKTLCTQPCCQSGVMLDWWHPKDDPSLQRDYWARLHTSFRQTHTQAQAQVITCMEHITSQGSHGRTLRWPSVPVTLGYESEVE